MTQDDYKLWTGQSSSYTSAEWTKITAAASARLASFLCLEALPTTLPADLEELLANFIAGVLSHQGSAGEVERKTVRNFTVDFRESTAANAFAYIGQQYGDTIEKYSKCELSIRVEGNAHHCCGGLSCDCL